MRIREAGKIADDLWFLGNRDACVYLLQSDSGATLINGGVACVVPELLAQFKKFGIDDRRIDKLVILHGHFDHIGITPFFQRRNPALTVYAHAQALKNFHNPKALAVFNRLDAYAVEKRGVGAACEGLDLEWRADVGDVGGVAIADGDRIDLGNSHLEVFEMPGHSACSIAVYHPQLGALFPSDGGGVPFKDAILTYGTWDFAAYIKSLDKLKDLKVNYLCADHWGYVKGDEAARYVTDAIVAAKATQARIKEALKRFNGDVDAAARAMFEVAEDKEFGELLSPDTFFQTYRLMLANVAAEECS